MSETGGTPKPRKRPGLAKGDMVGQRDSKGRAKPGKRKLTQKQITFWKALRNGATQTAAAEAAGYSAPAVAGSVTIRSPALRALHERWMRDQVEKGAELGLRLAADVLAGKAFATPMQWEAAQFFMKANGLDKPATGKDNETKDLNAMSLSELMELASQIDKPKPAVIAPSPPEGEAQAIEDTGETGTS